MVSKRFFRLSDWRCAARSAWLARYNPGKWKATYGQADGALDGQVLGTGTLDQLGADALQRLDLAGGQSDADAVSLGLLSKVLLALLVRHFDGLGGGWFLGKKR